MQVNVTRQNDHLRLVSILHYLGGALALCIALYVGFWVLVSPQIRPHLASFGDPTGIAAFGVVALAVTLCAAPLLSGFLISNQRLRIFSILASLLFLPFFPIGTLIGIYSVWVLAAPMTKIVYSADPH